MNMGFYSWLTYLLLGDCGHFETNFDAFLDFLEKGDPPDTNSWDFTATHKFVEVQRSQRKLNQSGMSLVDGALKLLENPSHPVRFSSSAMMPRSSGKGPVPRIDRCLMSGRFAGLKPGASTAERLD